MATKKQVLSSASLKDALWVTLQGVQNKTIDASEAKAISSQAREILRTISTQLKISNQAERKVPLELVKFSENR